MNILYQFWPSVYAQSWKIQTICSSAVYDQTDQLSMIKLTVQLLFFDSFFDNSRKSQQTTNQRWTHSIRKRIKSGKKLPIHFFLQKNSKADFLGKILERTNQSLEPDFTSSIRPTNPALWATNQGSAWLMITNCC